MAPPPSATYIPRKSRNGGSVVISPRHAGMGHVRLGAGPSWEPKDLPAEHPLVPYGRTGVVQAELGQLLGYVVQFCHVGVQADLGVLWSFSVLPLATETRFLGRMRTFLEHQLGKVKNWGGGGVVMTLGGKTSENSTTEADPFPRVYGKGQDLREFSKRLPL